jgi:8-oxo-dGTP diphosphatase
MVNPMADTTPPMTKPRVAAGALFFDADARVLLVKPTYKDGWDIPGGYVEPDETPLQACRREVREELGLEPDIHELLVTDWAPSTAEGDKLLFVFDGGTLTAAQLDAITLPADELETWAFKSRDELADVLPPRLQRRIGKAIDAWRAGRQVYLEHGELPAAIQVDAGDWWTTDHVAT